MGAQRDAKAWPGTPEANREVVPTLLQVKITGGVCFSTLPPPPLRRPCALYSRLVSNSLQPNDCEFLILLSLPPEDHRCAPQHPISGVLGIEPWTLCVLDKHSTN